MTPTSLFGLPEQAPHERVLLATDPATGLKAILAVHSTARGPAFGGCRLWHYESDAAALNDALRLSQGMSLKNALADLPFGGGKAVILKPQGAFDRPALFAAFGRAVQSLAGAYITAEDVGTTTADMRGMQAQTPFVSGIPREGAFGGDPSPKTAWGVLSPSRPAPASCWAARRSKACVSRCRAWARCAGTWPSSCTGPAHGWSWLTWIRPRSSAPSHSSARCPRTSRRSSRPTSTCWRPARWVRR